MEYIKVKLPDKKITYKPSTNPDYKYVYKTIRAYRNEKGQPTSKTCLIGKVYIKEPSVLLANPRFFKQYLEHKENQVPISMVDSIGGMVLLYELFDQLELKDMLEDIFGKVITQKIFLYASYMVESNNSMMYSSQWMKTHYNPTDQEIGLNKFSEFFKDIEKEKIDEFLNLWIQKHIENESIAYDITSISTYSSNLTLSEFGYNRDKDKLPQINMAMYYGYNSSVPISYDIYNGSIQDKSHLIYMFEKSRIEKLFKNTNFIFDAGFISDDNLKYFTKNNISYISSIPQSRTVYKLLVKNDDFIRDNAYFIDELDVFARRQKTQIGSVESIAHIYFSSSKRAREDKQLFSDINMLKQIVKQGSKMRGLGKYFDVLKRYETGIEIIENNQKINKALKENGFFVLLTNNPHLSSFQVLKMYREKDRIEKSFCAYKNSIKMKRTRCHNDKTLNGKIFVSFISLILRSKLHSLLEGKYSVREVINELENISMVHFENGESQIVRLTKKQKQIMSLLSIGDLFENL
jgi:transposase